MYLTGQLVHLLTVPENKVSSHHVPHAAQLPHLSAVPENEMFHPQPQLELLQNTITDTPFMGLEVEEVMICDTSAGSATSVAAETTAS
jgi:hypothetical protein